MPTLSKLLGRKKSPSELVASTIRNIKVLEESKNDAALAKALEKISINLLSMKHMLYGHDDNSAVEREVKVLCEELISKNLLYIMLQYIKDFKFEARKDVAMIYNFILRQRNQEAVEYILKNDQILHMLVKGYDDTDMALNCGSILREAIRSVELNMHILNNPSLFNLFFKYVELSTFDVASDAFSTFKLMLTRNSKDVAKFLETNHQAVFSKFNELLKSDNYVTKRQSLKLLGELLLCRDNFTVMMRYIADVENLKILMNLLRGAHKAIQFEAFHVFKIFVANPRKSKQVLEILLRNKEKLIKFLDKFQNEKDDESFMEEKAILLKTLRKLDESMLEKAQPFVPPQQQQQEQEQPPQQQREAAPAENPVT